MSEKIDIAYIGPKPLKRDTITGSRLTFPRNTPVPVSPDIAYQLLNFPTVFVTADKVASILGEQESAEANAVRLQQEQAELERKKAEENSFVVMVGDQETDISKYTAAQLATLAESLDLGITKDAQEKVDNFRARVRDAIKTVPQKEGE
ncbi:hypothetical protein PMPD1_2468 [Paramixta manurensis]|uniref:Uncharacterized protein n=1 Tax=Paramixta manurensis TaxID=2740817 RepID=A0A6M8UI46_9GAMM|nr:hypothetical protein PMPD1_2468 [Erwiniaceae bacterium PD-1]